jgi:hypothetical protein
MFFQEAMVSAAKTIFLRSSTYLNIKLRDRDEENRRAKNEETALIVNKLQYIPANEGSANSKRVQAELFHARRKLMNPTKSAAKNFVYVSKFGIVNGLGTISHGPREVTRKDEETSDDVFCKHHEISAHFEVFFKNLLSFHCHPDEIVSETKVVHMLTLLDGRGIREDNRLMVFRKSF